jgi:hypothetical protein
MSRCDIGSLVKDYVKPLMQATTMTIHEYNMRLLTTKCLNTAVMFMVLFFAKKGALKTTRYCDVDNVVLRHRSNAVNNSDIAADLARKVKRRTKNRYVYYVMLTDGDFLHPNGGKVFFPGHVMVWEKVPHRPNKNNASPADHHYYIYQSYINQYDFAGSLEFHNTPVVDKITMDSYLETLQRFMAFPVWDESMVTFWKSLTNVDTTSFLGASPQDCFYMCYQAHVNTVCLSNLEKFVRTTLEQIPQTDDGAIYGNVARYNSRSVPLTNREMFRQLTQLLLKINKTKCAICQRQ